MDLIESVNLPNNTRGITLNHQEVDLFNIIDTAKDEDEAKRRINDYLRGLFEASKRSDLKRLSLADKIKQVIEENDSVDQTMKKEMSEFIFSHALDIRKCWDSREKLEGYFEEQGKDPIYVDAVLDMRKYFEYQHHGILTFLVDKDGKVVDSNKADVDRIDEDKTYQKVRAMYEHTVSSLKNGENRYNSLTLDSQGKFSTVAGFMDIEKEAEANPEDYNLVALRQGYEFAERHGMDIRINTLVFFKDFQDRFVGEPKEKYEIALINYGKAVASVVNEFEGKGVSTFVDMFNEFVDYFEPFSERTDAWHSKLSVEDMCRIASVIKKEMPNARFCYNDWNYENAMKRETISSVLDRIFAYEKEHPENGRIIDHIGMQFHTSINDIEGAKESLEDMKKYGLPIYITELDISKGLDGVDYEGAIQKYKVGDKAELLAISKYEQLLQNRMMKILRDAVQDGTVYGITEWSISDELCMEKADGKEASVTGMSYDGTDFRFFGKDMDRTIEITEPELKLIEESKKRFREKEKTKVNQNPIQDFSYHNHTLRCGHAASDTGLEEYIEQAIKGGIKTLAFTDHMPIPGDFNKEAKSRMDMAEIDSYLREIKHFREKYAGVIDIQAGFEMEFSQREKMGAKNNGVNHFEDLKRRCEEMGLPYKMVIGQHHVVDEKGRTIKIGRQKDGSHLNIDNFKRYVNDISFAMYKGIPDIIAHPDIFMQGRKDFGPTEEFMTRMICKAARETGTALEINFGRIAQKYNPTKPISEQHIEYPSPDFWRIVAEETEKTSVETPIKVIFGKDSHHPGQLSETRDYLIARDIIGAETLSKLYFVKDDLKTRDTEILDRLGIRKLDEGPSAERKEEEVK